MPPFGQRFHASQIVIMMNFIIVSDVDIKGAECIFQMIHAHAGPVIAVSVSPDGKFLVSFSHLEQKIKFWQVSLTFVNTLSSLSYMLGSIAQTVGSLTADQVVSSLNPSSST